MEESNKSAVLSDLYAVRAAMSLISENDDKTQERYDRINQLNADIDGYNQRIEDLEQTRRAELKPYETQTAIDDLNKEKAELEKERELLQEKHDKKMRDSKHAYRDCFVGICEGHKAHPYPTCFYDMRFCFQVSKFVY